MDSDAYITWSFVGLASCCVSQRSSSSLSSLFPTQGRFQPFPKNVLLDGQYRWDSAMRTGEMYYSLTQAKTLVADT
jgi:hypothetical protein